MGFVGYTAGTEAGVYNGTIEVKSENYQQTLHVQVTIQNQYCLNLMIGNTGLICGKIHG